MKLRDKALASNRTGSKQTAEWAERNREGQYLHRMGIVRNEARITNIVRAFFSGKPYSAVERGARLEPDWGRITELANQYCERDSLSWRRFSNQPLSDAWDGWLEEAKAYFNANRIKPNLPREKVQYSA